MAIVKITPDKMDLNTGKAVSAATALDGTDGIYIDYTGKDNNILLLLSGSSSDTVTIKAGDGLQGVADETVQIQSSGITAINLESGRFKICSGEYAGYVHLTGASTTKVQAIELPV